MKRRRFLALSAAVLCSGAAPAPVRWTGRALGAEVSLILRAPEAQARAAIAEIISLLEQVEAAFSLYRTSELTRLNQVGRLRPSSLFRDLIQKADTAHRVTGGLFDPTVQPLWEAVRNEHPLPRHLVGWERVEIGRRITLGQGQALTFNGIAQGFATDLARKALAARGLTNILVNIGEYAALGGPWEIGIADPAHGLIARRSLTTGAIATSSAVPHGVPHVFAPNESAPLHATVSVEADHAWLADALSTAALFMTPPALAELRRVDGVQGVLTVAPNGTVATI